MDTKNLKPFNLEAAKAGAPVCTRDGHKARILCFDRLDDCYPIVALVKHNENLEIDKTYTLNGVYSLCAEHGKNDLMMLPTKHELWGVMTITQRMLAKLFPTEKEAEAYRRDMGLTGKSLFELEDLEVVKVKEWEE